MLTRSRKPRSKRTQRTEQREATKRALVEAARELFAREGYDGVSVTDIGKRAGVSASLINAHFGGKGGLLYELVNENNAPQEDHALEAAKRARTPLTKLSRVIHAYAEADLSDPRLLAAMQAFSWTWPEEFEADNVQQRRRHETLLADIVRSGIEAGEFRALDVERTVTTIWAIYTWGLRPAVFEGKNAAECAKAIAAQIRDLLVDG